ncbi:hypothetical protein ABC974_27335 [Sphingomonas oligophenolica]|uniref:Uncharacterized protein n=1 Tax=Sphingomonas oligophenolica TaxID=301154 RepID=A0ABU9YC22_9SPHN
MRNIGKSGFVWPFIGGFLLGAIGLVTLEPAAVTRTLVTNVATAAHLAH